MSQAYDDALLQRVIAVRRAVRSLFARAVRPEPPSPADADRLLADPDAVTVLNDAAALVPANPRLAWPDGGPPTVLYVPVGELAPGDRLVALLAQAAIDFLTGPSREKLRACTAPRCVRYFVKEHGRQEWCKASCGNRARAARHYRRHRREPAPDEGGAGPSITD